jgi:hypothetical protein
LMTNVPAVLHSFLILFPWDVNSRKRIQKNRRIENLCLSIQ